MSNKRINAIVTIGGAINGSLSSAFGLAKNKVDAVGSSVAKLKREQSDLARMLQQGNLGGALDSVRAKYNTITKEIEKAAAAQAKMERASRRQALAQGVKSAAVYSLGVAGAVVGAAAFPVMAAANFEQAMLGVAKQVDGARDSSGRLTSVYFDMQKQIQLLGREMPTATGEIAKMVAAGARMGIPKDELIEFTKTAGMMAEAFELPAEELADNMGKIQKLFGLKTQASVRSLADAINYLDDNAISKGGDIIDFLQRAGGAAGSVKITGSQMAALGSTLLTLGETSDTAGTSVKAFFVKLGSAEKGTAKLRAAMAQLGLPLREIQKGMQVDAQGTLLRVLDKVRQLPKDQQIGVLTQIAGLEHAGTLSKLANGVEEYRKQIGLANSELANGSVAREYGARLQTFNAQWEITKNRVSEVGVAIGSAILPALNDVLSGAAPMISNLVDWAGSKIKGITESSNFKAMIQYEANQKNAAERANAIADETLKLKPAKANVWTKTALVDAQPPLVEIPPVPKLPNKAGSRSGGTNSTVNSITIHQQPGQNSKELADEMIRQLERRDAVKKRSSTVDGAGAQ